MIKLKKKKARKLDLSDKNLDKFPDPVFADKKIVSLDLSDNQIKEIPAKIRDLKDLRYLHLENNQIKQLHNGILGARSLRCLYLKGNPMKKLPDFIKENAKFTISMDSGIHHYYSKVTLEGDNRKLQQEIGEEVDGIVNSGTDFENVSYVPTVADKRLTFPRHSDRKGFSLDTCVLFVDIRDSVKKNNDHRVQVLAKMYSAFVYGVLRISKEYNGHVRNIIGDRVMIVFDKESCCDNAVKCAGAIMYFSLSKMGKTLPNDTFRCGIGIHYGNMNVIKVGLSVTDDENNDYKNLVWMGEPANLASRLTDMAGKGDLPSVVISKNVYQNLTVMSLKKNFVALDKKNFKDIEFNVYGCNLLIK